MNTSVAYIVVICLSMTSKAAYGAIGVNWGRQSAQRLTPSIVVDLLLQNGVQHARVISAEKDILEAFSGSGINLTVGVFNPYRLKSQIDADGWVQQNLQYFGPANIRRVYIGNYIFKYGLNNQTLKRTGIDALRFLQNALNSAGYGDHIKASLPHTARVLKDKMTKPSEAEFMDEIATEMNETLQILMANNCPFVIDIYPVLYCRVHHLHPSFAFPDNKSELVVKDVDGAVYNNVFDYVYDSFIWALEKVGAGDLEVIVGQIGWPTDGYPGANASAAERFYKGLLPMVASKKGTPKRPGKEIDTYLHSLTDESTLLDTYARHWGIYRSNGEPKYKIDLTGQGRDIFPSRAKGIMRMPERWCMFNEKTHDAGRVASQFKLACNLSDCTSLDKGGSCSQLDDTLKTSYAFNMYFQFQYQDETACVFEGLGKVITENPSTESCVFPVEVVRGENMDDKVSSSSSSDTKRMHHIFVILLSIIWSLSRH